MVTCCFAGHRQTPHCLFKEIIIAVEKLVLATDEIEFLSGGMGDFDKLCEKAVQEIKKECPKKSIRLYRYFRVANTFRTKKNTSISEVFLMIYLSVMLQMVLIISR